MKIFVVLRYEFNPFLEYMVCFYRLLLRVHEGMKKHEAYVDSIANLVIQY